MKDAVRDHDEWYAGEHGEDQAKQRHENMRKRAKKALKKGSLEKGNQIHEITGLKTNKFDN